MQKLVTIAVNIESSAMRNSNMYVRNYPEVDELFKKGMRIESIHQTPLTNSTYLITLLFTSDQPND